MKHTVVVHGNEGPVGDDTSDADSVRVIPGRSWTGDQVLNCGSVEELDVRELQNLAEECRCEQCSVLDSDPVTIILIRDAELVEEELGGLTHDHGTEKLATEPSTTTRGDASLDNGNLEVGPLRCEHESSGETARSGTDDNDVGLGVGVEIFEVAASWTILVVLSM